MGSEMCIRDRYRTVSRVPIYGALWGPRVPGLMDPGLRVPGLRDLGPRVPGLRDPGPRDPGLRDPGPGGAAVSLEIPGRRRLTRDSRNRLLTRDSRIYGMFFVKISGKIWKIGFLDSWDQNKILNFLWFFI